MPSLQIEWINFTERKPPQSKLVFLKGWVETKTSQPFCVTAYLNEKGHYLFSHDVSIGQMAYYIRYWAEIPRELFSVANFNPHKALGLKTKEGKDNG